MKKNVQHVWTWQEKGDPLNSLGLETAPLSQINEEEVLVANKFIGLNPVDWKFIEWGSATWRKGHIPGVDAAGIVIAVGKNVDPMWLNQKVCYHQSLHKSGTFSTHTVVNSRVLMAVPADLSLALAAAFPCPVMTAWQAIEKIPVKEQRPLLVAGAAGSVGRALVQLAAFRGFSVIALANSHHHAALIALGASECITDESAIIAPLFAALDTRGAEEARHLAPYLGANGHLLCIQDRLESPAVPAFTKAISYHEVALNALHEFGNDKDWDIFTAAGEQLLAALSRGECELPMPDIQEFMDLPKALEAIKRARKNLKTVIHVPDTFI